MSGFMFGFVVVGLGTVAMWTAGILQTCRDEIRDDSRVLLGVGLGMFLAGCSFSTFASLLH